MRQLPAPGPAQPAAGAWDRAAGAGALQRHPASKPRLFSGIWRALDKCELSRAVKAVPGGLDAPVREAGENWSVGQRQLICLARVLLRRTRVLVMDEASAFIDIETDNTLQRMIRSEFAGCTVLTVAHRLATIMDYDLIAVLDDGRVAEFGTPAELLGLAPAEPSKEDGGGVEGTGAGAGEGAGAGVGRRGGGGGGAGLFAALVDETGPTLAKHLRGLVRRG